MRLFLTRARAPGFSLLESLLMIGLMSILSLICWAIFLKESDPERQGAGVWDRMETPFVPAFQDAGEPLMDEPAPQTDPLMDLLPDNESPRGN
jgi:hypothetical protein